MKKFFVFVLILSMFTLVNVKALGFVPVLDDGSGGGREFEVTASGSCDSVIGGEFKTWLQNAFKFIRNVGVVLCVLLTVFDFVGVIVGSKDDDLKNAFNRTIKRLIAAILLILIPVLVDFIIAIINSADSGIALKNCL